MSVPPTLWGHVPQPAKSDPRWVAVKDEPVFIGSTPPIGTVPEINQWVQRRIEYRREQFDEWSPPQVTLDRGYGDCEDIVILKRAVLLTYGFERVFFLLVRDLIQRQAHAVLLVDDDGWKIIDSCNAQTLPVDEVRDYRPLLAFDGDGAWSFKGRDG